MTAILSNLQHAALEVQQLQGFKKITEANSLFNCFLAKNKFSATGDLRDVAFQTFEVENHSLPHEAWQQSVFLRKGLALLRVATL